MTKDRHNNSTSSNTCISHAKLLRLIQEFKKLFVGVNIETAIPQIIKEDEKNNEAINIKDENNDNI